MPKQWSEMSTKEKAQGIVFMSLIFIVVFLGILISLGGDDDSQDSQQEEQKPELSLNVHFDDSTPQNLVIENLTDTRWSECTADFDEVFEYSSEFAIDTTLTQHLSITNFMNDDNERFNPAVHGINEVGITCGEPVIGVQVFTLQ